MLSVWITGASSGIGEACACRYAEQGARLVLTSSSAERLETVAAKCRELGASEVAVLPYDLSVTEGIDILLQSRIPVYQLGIESSIPVNVILK